MENNPISAHWTMGDNSISANWTISANSTMDINSRNANWRRENNSISGLKNEVAKGITLNTVTAVVVRSIVAVLAEKDVMIAKVSGEVIGLILAKKNIENIFDGHTTLESFTFTNFSPETSLKASLTDITHLRVIQSMIGDFFFF
jgi:hypothetical protein